MRFYDIINLVISVIYVISGEDSFLCHKQLNKILKDESIDLSFSDLVSYDCLETPLTAIIDEALMIPLLNDKRCLILKNPYFLTSQHLKTDFDNDLECLLNYLNAPNPTTILIFMANYPKLDDNKKIMKSLRKCARFFEFNLLNQSDLKIAVASYLKENGLVLDKSQFNVLLERLPNDLETVYHELDKIVLYGNEIDSDTIKKLIVKPIEDDTFALVNAVLKKDLKKSLKIWSDLVVLNKEPIQLVALIASQFRILYQVKILNKSGYNDQEIANKLNSKPYPIKKAKEMIYDHSEKQILEILDSLCNLDLDLKSKNIDKRLCFELFLLRLESGEMCGIN